MGIEKRCDDLDPSTLGSKLIKELTKCNEDRVFEENVIQVVATSQKCWLPFMLAGNFRYLKFSEDNDDKVHYIDMTKYKGPKRFGGQDGCKWTGHTYLAGGKDAPNPLGMYKVLEVLKGANHDPQLDFPEEIVIDEGSNVPVIIKARDVLTKWDNSAELKFWVPDYKGVDYILNQGTISGPIQEGAERIRVGSVTLYADDNPDDNTDAKIMIQVEDSGWPCNDCTSDKKITFEREKIKWHWDFKKTDNTGFKSKIKNWRAEKYNNRALWEKNLIYPKPEPFYPLTILDNKEKSNGATGAWQNITATVIIKNVAPTVVLDAVVDGKKVELNPKTTDFPTGDISGDTNAKTTSVAISPGNFANASIECDPGDFMTGWFWDNKGNTDIGRNLQLVTMNNILDGNQKVVGSQLVVFQRGGTQSSNIDLGIFCNDVSEVTTELVGEVLVGEVVLNVKTTDPSNADTLRGFDYEINWGDGSDILKISHDNQIKMYDHPYDSKGEHTITVTGIDKDHGSSTVSTVVETDKVIITLSNQETTTPLRDLIKEIIPAEQIKETIESLKDLKKDVIPVEQIKETIESLKDLKEEVIPAELIKEIIISEEDSKDISDRDVTDSLRLLIEEKFIDVKVESLLPETDQPENEELHVPAWFAQTMDWWFAEDLPDDQFKAGIEWMIKNKIIRGV